MQDAAVQVPQPIKKGEAKAEASAEPVVPTGGDPYEYGAGNRYV